MLLPHHSSSSLLQVRTIPSDSLFLKCKLYFNKAVVISFQDRKKLHLHKVLGVQHDPRCRVVTLKRPGFIYPKIERSHLAYSKGGRKIQGGTANWQSTYIDQIPWTKCPNVNQNNQQIMTLSLMCVGVSLWKMTSPLWWLLFRLRVVGLHHTP